VASLSSPEAAPTSQAGLFPFSRPEKFAFPGHCAQFYAGAAETLPPFLRVRMERP